jgi:hypothetical protein
MATCRTIVIGALLLLGAHAAPGADAGMEAHVDPQTGALVPEAVTPAPAPLPTAPRPRAAELPAPGGGMMIDVSGRFMSTMVATVEPDGSVHVDCVTGEHDHRHR